MKIRMTFKDPDGAQDSLDEAARDSMPPEITDKDEREAIYELRREKVASAVKRWIEYGEYVTIEIDTETDTAVVVPLR